MSGTQLVSVPLRVPIVSVCCDTVRVTGTSILAIPAETADHGHVMRVYVQTSACCMLSGGCSSQHMNAAQVLKHAQQPHRQPESSLRKHKASFWTP